MISELGTIAEKAVHTITAAPFSPTDDPRLPGKRSREPTTMVSASYKRLLSVPMDRFVSVNAIVDNATCTAFNYSSISRIRK